MTLLLWQLTNSQPFLFFPPWCSADWIFNLCSVAVLSWGNVRFISPVLPFRFDIFCLWGSCTSSHKMLLTQTAGSASPFALSSSERLLSEKLPSEIKTADKPQLWFFSESCPESASHLANHQLESRTWRFLTAGPELPVPLPAFPLESPVCLDRVSNTEGKKVQKSPLTAHYCDRVHLPRDRTPVKSKSSQYVSYLST